MSTIRHFILFVNLVNRMRNCMYQRSFYCCQLSRVFARSKMFIGARTSACNSNRIEWPTINEIFCLWYTFRVNANPCLHSMCNFHCDTVATTSDAVRCVEWQRKIDKTLCFAWRNWNIFASIRRIARKADNPNEWCQNNSICYYLGPLVMQCDAPSLQSLATDLFAVCASVRIDDFVWWSLQNCIIFLPTATGEKVH